MCCRTLFERWSSAGESIMSGTVPADYITKVSKLTWVVQPHCRLAAAASSSGIGVGGWSDSLVRMCLSFASNKKPEEYRKHVAEWREESEAHALLMTLVLAVTVVPALRFIVDKLSGVRECPCPAMPLFPRCCCETSG